MPKKIQITKIDIIRWVAVLPISVSALLLYGEISSWINYAYLTYLHGNGDSHFTLYIDCILFPTIILLCGYFISPRYKFKSSLVLTVFYVLTTIYELLTNEYVLRASNPFLIAYLVTILLGLYGICKLEENRMPGVKR
jgi:hypothetical protein